MTSGSTAHVTGGVPASGLVTIQYHATAPLPGVRLQFSDLTGTAALTATTTGANSTTSTLRLSDGGSATVGDLRITLVHITRSSAGVPPSVQIRYGPA